MNIAVLGTGMVGRTLATRLQGLGHSVVLGTRDPESTMSRTDTDRMGNPPFPTWHADHAEITLATFADAARGADLLVLATNGEASLEALRLAGAENLAGKLVLDVSNPLDFSAGFPPSLFVKDTDSLGEQIQRAFPEARVVKTLNTMTASVMADPQQLGQSSTVFVAGNDDGAKQTVVGLLESFGHDDVFDLGDISGARGTEMLLPVWLRLMGTLGTGAFNFKIVR